MGMRCRFDHGIVSANSLGDPNYKISYNFTTNDQTMYERVVAAISNAMGYQEEVEEKKDALGFGVPEAAQEEDE